MIGSEKLSGLIAAVYTPMHPNGALNLAEIPKMVDHLEQTGVRGIYICGSTGEGVSLTIAERLELAEAYVAEAKGRLTTIVHVGHNSLTEACMLAKHAQRIGAEITSATAPSYYSVESIDTLVRSMAIVANGAPDLPFYYYHIPAFTGSRFSMPEFLRIGQRLISNLAGLKFTAPETHEFQECLEYQDRAFDVVWGTDEMLLSALTVGANAAIGSTYNIAAPVFVRLKEAFEKGDLQSAKMWQSRGLLLINFLKTYPFHSAVKCVLTHLGFSFGPCRLPLVSLTGEQELALLEELEAANLFCPLDHGGALIMNGTAVGSLFHASETAALPSKDVASKKK